MWWVGVVLLVVLLLFLVLLFVAVLRGLRPFGLRQEQPQTDVERMDDQFHATIAEAHIYWRAIEQHENWASLSPLFSHFALVIPVSRHRNSGYTSGWFLEVTAGLPLKTGQLLWVMQIIHYVLTTNPPSQVNESWRQLLSTLLGQAERSSWPKTVFGRRTDITLSHSTLTGHWGTL